MILEIKAFVVEFHELPFGIGSHVTARQEVGV